MSPIPEEKFMKMKREENLILKSYLLFHLSSSVCQPASAELEFELSAPAFSSNFQHIGVCKINVKDAVDLTRLHTRFYMCETLAQGHF